MEIGRCLHVLCSSAEEEQYTLYLIMCRFRIALEAEEWNGVEVRFMSSDVVLWRLHWPRTDLKFLSCHGFWDGWFPKSARCFLGHGFLHDQLGVASLSVPGRPWAACNSLLDSSWFVRHKVTYSCFQAFCRTPEFKLLCRRVILVISISDTLSSSGGVSLGLCKIRSHLQRRTRAPAEATWIR